MNTNEIIRDINAAMAACQRLQDQALQLDLQTAHYSHSLRRCQGLAGDIKALLEEATDA